MQGPGTRSWARLKLSEERPSFVYGCAREARWFPPGEQVPRLERLQSADKFSGGYGEGVPPVPIPNTEVKPLIADGTARETVWESRTLPDFFCDPRTAQRGSGVSLLNAGTTIADQCAAGARLRYRPTAGRSAPSGAASRSGNKPLDARMGAG